MDGSVLQSLHVFPIMASSLPKEIYNVTVKTSLFHFKAVKFGHLSSSYIDDSYLQGNDFNDCVTNVIATTKLFDSLGFLFTP